MSLVTVRGTTQVTWKPAYTLTVASPDGPSLPANGTGHPLTISLVRTSNNQAIPDRRVQITTSPVGKTGHGQVIWTDGGGIGQITVREVAAASVVYTGTLLKNPSGSSGVTGTTTIGWTVPPPPPPPPPDPPTPGACDVRLFSTTLISPASPPAFPCAVYQFVYHYFVNNVDSGFYASTSQYSPDGTPISGACLCNGFSNAICPFDGLPVTADGTICAETDGDPYSVFLADQCDADIIDAGCEPL